jgi:hypothetical protein
MSTCTETFCNVFDHHHESEGRPVDFGPNTEALDALSASLKGTGGPWAYTAICAYCGKTRDRHMTGTFGDVKPVGRRPHYCSNACKQAAYRTRVKNRPTVADLPDLDIEV